MKKFIEQFKTASIATIDKQNLPFSSYAPFVHENNRFYIYISDIATHAQNIKLHPHAGLFFIEDESKSENLFARKRISLQCDVSLIPRDSALFKHILFQFAQKFNPETIDMLQKMVDFNLYEFKTLKGEATFGFGEAYTIGGAEMNELIPRSGGSGHKSK